MAGYEDALRAIGLGLISGQNPQLALQVGQNWKDMALRQAQLDFQRQQATGLQDYRDRSLALQQQQFDFQRQREGEAETRRIEEHADKSYRDMMSEGRERMPTEYAQYVDQYGVGWGPPPPKTEAYAPGAAIYEKGKYDKPLAQIPERPDKPQIVDWGHGQKAIVVPGEEQPRKIYNVPVKPPVEGKETGQLTEKQARDELWKQFVGTGAMGEVFPISKADSKTKAAFLGVLKEFNQRIAGGMSPREALISTQAGAYGFSQNAPQEQAEPTTEAPASPEEKETAPEGADGRDQKGWYRIRNGKKEYWVQ